jgi:hypothetical protein
MRRMLKVVKKRRGIYTKPVVKPAKAGCLSILMLGLPDVYEMYNDFKDIKEDMFASSQKKGAQ